MNNNSFTDAEKLLWTLATIVTLMMFLAWSGNLSHGNELFNPLWLQTPFCITSVVIAMGRFLRQNF